jgi:hypothetical protein
MQPDATSGASAKTREIIFSLIKQEFQNPLQWIYLIQYFQGFT